MKLGQWDNAILKALFWVSLPGPLYFLVGIGLPNTAEELATLGGLLLVYYSIYGFISLVGWMVIGMPVHWLVCRYDGGKIGWYVLAIALVAAVVGITAGFYVGCFMAIVALLQLGVFRYFVYRP